MGRLSQKLAESVEKVAGLQLALDASVSETVVTDISESHGFLPLAAVDEVLVSEHSTLTKYQEGVTSAIDCLLEAPNLSAGRLERFSAVVTSFTSQEITDGRIHPDAEISRNRLLAAAKVKRRGDSGGG